MLSNLKRVLCATDGSHSSEKAVDFAVDMAGKLDASVVFATVNVVSDKDMADEPMFWDSNLSGAADQQVHQPLEAAAAKAKRAGVKDVQYVVLHGRDIAGNVVKFAQRNGYDHLVIGSQGRTGLARVLLGSIAEDIVRHAHCPVTVVR